MIRIFLPVLIFCWAQASAQSDFRFADSTAQWNVLYTSLGVSLPSYSAQTRIFVVKGDTSNQYQIIGRVNSSNDYQLRKDSTNKVYVIPPNSSSESLLYNVGDTISVYHSFFPDVKCIVDSIDTIVLGKVRKRIMLQCGESHFGGFFYPDIWIEGIGSVLNEFFSPGVSPGIVDGPNVELLCFFENDTLLFHNQNFDTCVVDSFWVGILKNEKRNLNIFPHPVTRQSIIFLSKQYSHIQLQIFDATGKLLLIESSYETDNIPINKKDIGNGFFFYHISADKDFFRGKIITN